MNGQTVIRRPQVGDAVQFFAANPEPRHNSVGEGPFAAIVLRGLGGTQFELRVFAPSPLGDDYVAHAVRKDDVSAPPYAMGDVWAEIPDAADFIPLAAASSAP